ncbi:hypothetical protein BT96DRAFT_942381 [Gymnopus androsaceus JB14]|uniref:JmjC domain-containing protein n=1 Tax=Gymnopus androsaceus JB14 TaxID=1447944 RepID=A0A6A4HAZ7_9AGAR|nr:hypothetical protein BT96DRAFT_942381 [Gymnopus androsaceus JB14]
MDRVLDSIVELKLLGSFCPNKTELHHYFKEKFDPIRDHTGFFFPALGAIIKQEAEPSGSSVPAPHWPNDNSSAGPVTGLVLSGVGLNTVQLEWVVNPLESDNAPISPIGLGSGDGAAMGPHPNDGLHLDSASNVPQMVPNDDDEVVSLGSGDGLGEVFGPSKLDKSIPVSSLPSGTPKHPSALSLLSTYAFPSPGTVSGSNSGLLNQLDLAGAGVLLMTRICSEMELKSWICQARKVMEVGMLCEQPQAKRHSDSEDPSPKCQKLSEGKSRRTGKTTEARDVVNNNNNNMDIGEDCDQVPRLEVHRDKEREPSPVIHVYSADHANYYEYEGKHYSSQIAKDLQKLAAHMDVVRSKNSLPTGRPIEWVDGMTNFLKTSAKDLQDIFRCYPTIVNGVELMSSETCMITQDTTPAGLMLFLCGHPSGNSQTSKNVNSLDNPLSGGVPAPIQLATDLRAAVSVYKEFPSNIPVQIMNWGLLAKANAVHLPHVDHPGTCTWVAIEDGLKKWDLAFPPRETEEEEIANPAAYAAEMADGRNYDRGWNWYSVLLYPGSMLYIVIVPLHQFTQTQFCYRFMWPGTVHSVTTLQDCISLGWPLLF